MSFLSRLLIFKIGITLLAVVLPVLLLPTGWAETLMGFEVPRPLAILYGVQVSAVLVAYALALKADLSGRFPKDILWMGVASNGGATLAILAFVEGWQKAAGTIVFGGITLALLAVLQWPDRLRTA